MARDNEGDAGALAMECWRGGLFCAESVAVALASRQGVDSPLLPSMASGFCGGMGHTAGPCGALTGAVMGLGVALGRVGPADTTERVYGAVQTLVRRFTEEFGATGCSDLLGVDLGSPEGQRRCRDGELFRRCGQYTRRAAEIAGELIDARRQ